MTEERDTKLIFSPNVARKLLKLGNIIIDIKPNRDNKLKTVFVFKNDEHFRNTYGEAITRKESTD